MLLKGCRTPLGSVAGKLFQGLSVYFSAGLGAGQGCYYHKKPGAHVGGQGGGNVFCIYGSSELWTRAERGHMAFHPLSGPLPKKQQPEIIWL